MIWNMVVPGIVLLGLVIFVHELGHFLVAKARGVRVLRFSLGFGPAMLKKSVGETEYRVSWFPLGGYVQMAGDSPAEDGSMPDRPDEFLSHPWLGRLAIAAAGPAANLVTAFLVMVLVAWVGVSYPDYPNRLGPTPDTSAAYRHGLMEGDRIVAVGETPVKSWLEFSVAAADAPMDRPLLLAVERGDSTFRVELGAGDRRPVLVSLRHPADPPVIGHVVTGMPAYRSGLKEKDRILAVNGQPIKVWDELPIALLGQVDRPVRMLVDRGGRRFEIVVKPIDPEGKRGSRDAKIGIEPPRHSTYVERHPLPESIDLGFRATLSMVANVYGGMWLTLSRPLYYREYLGGPLFIAQAASEQARRGLDSYLQFLALINIAIMAFNLLPIPVLDGGHIALAILQGLRGRALSGRAYIRYQKVGLVVIGALFILILANDPLRLVQRQRALEKAPQEGQVEPVPP